MTFRMFFCLLLALCIGFSSALASESVTLSLPENSAVYSPSFALEVLALNSIGTAEETARQFESAGFTVLKQAHYGKDPMDASHTCAYTAASRSVSYRGEDRTLVCISVRGTGTPGEWLSNLDFAPSRSAAAAFAENFLYTAQDVFLGMQPVLSGIENPLLIVTGYSRGAACANLLGVLLNLSYGAENVFAYTFATPTTIRGELAPAWRAENVFNIINPADVVTLLPLPQWGFGRAGQDIVLGADAADTAQAQAVSEMFASLAGGITEYYTARHSLTGPGLAPDGITAFEMLSMVMTASSAQQDASAPGAPSPAAMFSAQSDFAPLLQLSATGGLVGEQHMPQAYLQLMLQQKP